MVVEWPRIDWTVKQILPHFTDKYKTLMGFQFHQPSLYAIADNLIWKTKQQFMVYFLFEKYFAVSFPSKNRRVSGFVQVMSVWDK